MTYIIEIDKKKCIGCQACTAISSSFVMKEEKAKPIKKTVEELGDISEAAASCATGAITIKN